MNLEELLPLLKPYRAVLVTGPQRSGTAIATKMLSQELGYEEVAEEQFGIHNVVSVLAFVAKGNVVIHMPALCHFAHITANTFKWQPTVVVLMRRPLADIHASEERIGWRTAYGGVNLKAEQSKYLMHYKRTSDDIAALKYEMWDTFQKKTCNAFDLDYASLRSHPLWKEERMEFTARQTE